MSSKLIKSVELIKRIRVVISCKADNGIVELSCLFKPFKKVLKRLVKLNICRNVAFDLVAVF